MTKEESVINLANGISKYYKDMCYASVGKQIKENYTEKDVIYALLAMVSLDLIYNKEDIVEQKNGFDYETKLADNVLDEVSALLTDDKYKELFTNSPTFITYLRNKLAHGDYYIEGEDLVLPRESDDTNIQGNKDIKINIKLFINVYMNLSSSLSYRFKGKSISKVMVEDMAVGNFDKKVETEDELNKYIGYQTLKEYVLTKNNGEDLTTEEQHIFLQFIETLKQNKDNISAFENSLSNMYSRYGYKLSISSRKITDNNSINDIRMAIKNINANDNTDIDETIYSYGEEVFKIVRNNYNTDVIKTGIGLNELILKEMYTSGKYDFMESLGTILKTYSPNIISLLKELYVTSALARFYICYCYPLEKVFKDDNEYHLDRSNEFDFSKLDLSEFNPNVLNIDTLPLTSKEAVVSKYLKQIKDYNKKISKIQNQIDWIKHNPNLTSKISILEDTISEIKEEMKEPIKNYTEAYKQSVLISNDYSKNSEYFKNRAILVGMRDAICHGNVTVENMSQTSDYFKLIIKFNDIYEGNLTFQLSTTLYNLDNLFEEYNLGVVGDYLVKKNKEKTLRK